MRKPTNNQTRSLLSSPIALLGIVVLLLLFMLVLTSMGDHKRASNPTGYDQVATGSEVSTNSWVNYIDTEHKIQFKHPKNWTVEKEKVENGTAILVFPKSITNADNKIKIVILNNSYFGIDGLPTKSVTINGQNGIMVDEGLYGFMHNGKYITLDAGYSAEAKPYFKALIQTVRFD